MARDVLTKDEIGALTRVVGRGRTAPRNRALIVLLWRTGLRISEALELAPSHVDHTNGVVHVRQAKRNKSRSVPMDPGALSIVADYQRVRATYETQRRSPLFCTLKGRPLAQQNVREYCVRWAERAGLDKHLHPHMFRHTYASELMREGFNARQIQELLGHESLQTTMEYLRSIGALPELVDAVHNRTPINLEAPGSRFLGTAAAIAGARRS